MSSSVGLSQLVTKLHQLVQQTAQAVNKKTINGELASAIKTTLGLLDSYNTFSEDTLYNNAGQIQILTQHLCRLLKAEADPTLVSFSDSMIEIIHDIEYAAKNRKVVFNAENLPTSSNGGLGTPTLTQSSEDIQTKNLKELLDDIEARYLTKEADFNRRMAELSATLETLESTAKAKLDTVDKLYIDTGRELTAKQISIDSQLGTITAATMAKDYAQFADAEKNTADTLRKFSYGAMSAAFVVALLLVCLTKGDLTLTESIIRLSLVLLASAPAAYLTRESAKHRRQENSHRQTSLDLIAITPYISSLSPTEQSQIKTQVALRLFGARNGQVSPSEGIPINTNDLLLKLLDKVDLSSKKDKLPD
jgi:hypothetical protein